MDIPADAAAPSRSRPGRVDEYVRNEPLTALSLAAAAGFRSVVVKPCPPLAHGLASAARAVAWKSVSGLYKIALAAETGVLRGHVVTQNLMFAARKN